jgi:peroxiredoxin Q/BCP
MRKVVLIVLVAVLALGFGTLRAQMPAAPAAAPAAPPLEIGAIAPDFAIPGATRYGVLRDPIKLSDFKGKTVVLAFFFKARTRG